MKPPVAVVRRRPHVARRLSIVGGAMAVAVLAFAAGRWTSAAAPVSRPPSAAPAVIPLDLALAALGARAAGEAPAPGVAAGPAAPARPATFTEAKVVAEASARLKLDELRGDMLSRCWPSGGLEGGRTSARLTFSLAFDADGREIARGISEDRAAPAGAFARCLRALPVGSLAIPPPGARVGVKVAMVFP
jgi:hypothetical protein